jgi:hypothetical protein
MANSGIPDRIRKKSLKVARANGSYFSSFLMEFLNILLSVCVISGIAPLPARGEWWVGSKMDNCVIYHVKMRGWI